MDFALLAVHLFLFKRGLQVSIWHELVENLLVKSAGAGKKRILGAWLTVSRQCPLPALEEVPCLGRPLEHKCTKQQRQGLCLSVCVSVCLRDHVAKGPCLRERLPPSEESQDPGGGGCSWYTLVPI